MKFRQFMAMPVVRQAFQITPRHRVSQSAYDACLYQISDLDNLDDGVGTFISYEIPAVGDWVVKGIDTSPYHCTDETFRKNYLVP
jgi:hypothetical protein